MKKIMLLATGLVLGTPALWAQLGGPANANQGMQQPQVQQGQAPQQQPTPAQAPVIPANPVARNAQAAQQSKLDMKKVQASEIKTLADIQKAEDHDINSVRKDTTLSKDARKKAIAQIRLKYSAMRRDARIAANKALKLDEKNDRNAKTAELKAQNKLGTPQGQ